ncbi:GPR1/FUN34/yaaH family-domain-containing protein [Aspergillus karnatakaensis]|uniref:GPR1/FUN34/yaaH family-domain-containing protein n=1 Tax=Aspergillus karnatakaensis TaxID=1810916 RepID=UPI003CCDB088
MESTDQPSKPSSQTRENALAMIPTSVTLSAEQFERLYLTPMTRQQPALAKQVGNPTPLALGGFVITTTPLSCCLMAWRGASGNGIAFIGPIVFLGGLLLLITSILEFILGNTFPCVVFGTIGGFWFAFAATMIPSFNAAAPYSPDGSTAAGLSSPDFLNTYGPSPALLSHPPTLPFPLPSQPNQILPIAFLFLTMSLLMLIFLVCATRTNAVYTLIFLCLLLVFLLLTAGYWALGAGDSTVGNRCVKGAGACLFIASLLGFYLLVAQMFEAVGVPVSVPVGDLAGLWGVARVGGGVR